IAADFLKKLKNRGGFRSIAGTVIKWLATIKSPENEADLMSYLLFDREYASALIEIGFNDAKAKEDKLADFFSS
ncbi:MAG TPA: phospholipase, partial [bacterium]